MGQKYLISADCYNYYVQYELQRANITAEFKQAIFRHEFNFRSKKNESFIVQEQEQESIWQKEKKEKKKRNKQC